MRSLLPTALALLAFAANSLLCRAALADRSIDAVSFTTLRIVSGALVLALLAWPRRARAPGLRDACVSGLWLYAYAIAFSLAYLALGAATGALILFGVVQLVMLGAQARRTGLAARTVAGALVAFGGLVVLVAPGVTAPDPAGAALMAVAGVAWGLYSLRGGGDPLARTGANFAAAAPLALAATLVAGVGHADPKGVALAVASGAITSGLGYVAWYAALATVDAGRAAVLQLAVPVIAALGAVALLGEPLDVRIVAGGAIVLGGIAWALGARTVRRHP